MESFYQKSNLRAEDGMTPGPDSVDRCTGSCVTTWKIVFVIILILEGFVFSHIVLFVRSRSKSSQALFKTVKSFGQALATGIFLATGLLHIFPEAIELVNGEHGGHGAEEGGHSEHGEEHHDDEHKNEHSDELEGHDDHGGQGHEAKFPWAFFVVLCGFYGLFFFERILLPMVFGVSAHGDHDTHDHQDEETALQTGENENIAHGEAEPEKKLESFRSRTFLISVIQVIGISFHSIFEAMVFGLSNDFSTILNLFIAIATHRWAVAIAISFGSSSKLQYLPFLVIFIIFAAFILIGVGIGTAVSNLSQAFQGILFSISAATFIYTGAYEGMADTFEHDHNKKSVIFKFINVLVGAAIISVITAMLVSNNIHG